MSKGRIVALKSYKGTTQSNCQHPISWGRNSKNLNHIEWETAVPKASKWKSTSTITVCVIQMSFEMILPKNTIFCGTASTINQFQSKWTHFQFKKITCKVALKQLRQNNHTVHILNRYAKDTYKFKQSLFPLIPTRSWGRVQ